MHPGVEYKAWDGAFTGVTEWSCWKSIDDNYVWTHRRNNSSVWMKEQCVFGSMDNIELMPPHRGTAMQGYVDTLCPGESSTVIVKITAGGTF